MKIDYRLFVRGSIVSESEHFAPLREFYQIISILTTKLMAQTQWVIAVLMDLSSAVLTKSHYTCFHHFKLFCSAASFLCIFLSISLCSYLKWGLQHFILRIAQQQFSMQFAQYFSGSFAIRAIAFKSPELKMT